MNAGSRPLVEVEDLRVHFTPGRGLLRGGNRSAVRAVDGVSFGVRRGETLGLVGESGCGKSTTGRAILRLYRPTEGRVIFDGQDLSSLGEAQLRRLRQRMQLIFQDPHASLDPRMTVGDILREPLDVFKIGDRRSRLDRVTELLRLVGLDREHSDRYPHEFSGGQRQRVGIARALSVEPEFVVCDEPISSLDVSVQAQIVNLLEELQDTLGLTYLFIAHDLAVIGHISDRVAVMYLGKLMELSDRTTLYSDPRHPYTKALLSAAPLPDPEAEETRKRIILVGDVPNPADPPSGCVFRTRCPIAADVCAEETPEWRNIGTPARSQWVACHFA